MECIVSKIAKYFYNKRIKRGDKRDNLDLVDWDKAERFFNTIFLILVYGLLFILHFFNKNIKFGILLGVVWLVIYLLFLFNLNFKNREARLPTLIIAFILTLFLIVPVDKYEKVFISPFEKINKIGPVEFFSNISKSEYGNSIIFDPGSIEKNYINNGGFEIPLFSKDSNWGSGKYSDLIKATNPYEPVYVIKFGGALVNADISSEESIDGKNSLHIRHESDKKDHVVGVLEQRVTLETGKYELSMKIKLNYAVSQGAVWIRFDSEKWLGASGIDIPDTTSRSSSWVERKKSFSIDNCGNFRDENGNLVFCLGKIGEYNNSPVFSTTFSIVTTDQCELWIDNIKLKRTGN